jgi:hypothetical protein
LKSASGKISFYKENECITTGLNFSVKRYIKAAGGAINVLPGYGYKTPNTGSAIKSPPG